MKYKIFIAINLPENIKKKLNSFRDKWPELPCRWTRQENLHITLEFLGFLFDEEIIELCQKIEELTQNKKVFSVFLNKICYAPLKNNKTPKMIWAVGKKIKEFNIVPHITLARIKSLQLRQMEEEERPEINEEIDLSFQVNSIEIMESQTKKAGPEYIILKSCQLGK